MENLKAPKSCDLVLLENKKRRQPFSTGVTPWGELRRSGHRPHASGCGPEAGLNAASAGPRLRAWFPQQQRGRAGCACAASRPAPAGTARGGAEGGLPGDLVVTQCGRSVGPRGLARGALRPRHRAGGSARCGVRSLLRPPQLVTRAPPGRRRSGVLAARALAWLLLWAAGLVGRLAADLSDAPFSSGIRATCSEIILRQEFLKDGFHRDLVIKVKFGESIEDLQTCRLLIRHYIPTGFFVDPYELASLRERNVTEAVMVSESFNIEAPNYLSKESEVLIYARQDAQCIDCFQAFLPVHYRYHRPHKKDGDTLIVVNNPELLMYCDQEFPVLKCWAQSKVAAPCALKSEEICQWNSMQYKSILKNLTLQVPVGLTIHTTLVCSVTLLITILCSTLILLAVFKYGHFSLFLC
ncbi:phosphatidylinositol-glycan biosynthesis class X protein-like [Peromyscus californicus insignis]|uniref:phosphatidylinositol-glycan biosynthesis class X protein-like n=1 Tax=Peromyscus californicus insignis TaxID=564181 RepID=UPI0022A6822E|nr:phosphatidylinositol-glycan biosynthesis class X protein-like [Peromyscus californicus insignis]